MIGKGCHHIIIAARRSVVPIVQPQRKGCSWEPFNELTKTVTLRLISS